MNQYFRKPRTPTIVAMVVFLVAFVFWLFEPQPEREIVRYPDLSWVIVTTTSTIPVVETTLPPETTPPATTTPPETIPPETIPPEQPENGEVTVPTSIQP